MSCKDFEAWISNPPYERMCDRGSPGSAWPRQYKNYETQLAWEAWQAATIKQQELDAEICDKRAAELCAYEDKSLRAMISTAESLAAAIRAQGD